MIFAIELKKCVADAGVFGVIVGKLCYGKKPCSIIMLKVHKGLKIGFYRTILLFGLPIHLGVKSGGEFLLNI